MALPFVNMHTHQASGKGVEAVLNVILKGGEKPEIPSQGFYSCGIHPWYLEVDWDKKLLKKLLTDIAQNKRCVALGEAGLDKSIDIPLSQQEDVFAMQAKLAEELGKPLIIHCVKAYAEVLSVRKSTKAEQVWIFHGFNSSVEMAQQLMDHGCMISLGKSLRNEKSKTRDVLSVLDNGQFFLETDDDNLSIEELYSLVAELKAVSPEELKKAMYEKFHTVFNID